VIEPNLFAKQKPRIRVFDSIDKPRKRSVHSKILKIPLPRVTTISKQIIVQMVHGLIYFRLHRNLLDKVLK